MYSQFFPEEDLAEILSIIKSGQLCGWWNSPEGGKYVRKLEEAFAEYIGVKHAIAVSSGTASIYIALRSLILPDNSGVAVGTYTHIGSVAPIVLAGLYPEIVDVDFRGNIRWSDIEDLAGSAVAETFVVLAVHELGYPCEMDEFPKGNILVEDCSQALGAKYKGKMVGSIGKLGCFSIGGDMTKTISTGEGGMITTNDDELAGRCRKIRNHGEKEGAMYPCFNFRMSDLQAAVGLIQMRTVAEQVEYQSIFAKYLMEHKDMPESIMFFDPMEYIEPANYIIGAKYWTHTNADIKPLRDKFLDALKERFEIDEVAHGLPRRTVGPGYTQLIHEIPYYRRHVARHRTFRNAQRVRDSAIWIDWHRWPTTREDIDQLVNYFKEIEG